MSHPPLSPDTSHATWRNHFQLFVILLLLLMLAACDLPGSSKPARGVPTAIPTPVPIDPTIADTAGCQPTNQPPHKVYILSTQYAKKDEPNPVSVLAFDEDGKKVWEQHPGKMVPFAYTGLSLNASDVFYLFFRKDGRSTLGSMDAQSGQIHLDLTVDSARLIGACDSLVYIQTDTAIQAYDTQTGTLAWQYKADFYAFNPLPQMISHKALAFKLLEQLKDDTCQGMCLSQSIITLDAKTGKQLWRHIYLDDMSKEILPIGPVAVSEQAVYVPKSGEGKQHVWMEKLSLGNGQTLWNTETNFPANQAFSDFLTVDHGVIYLDETHELYALNTLDGQEKWRNPQNHIAFPSNGNVYRVAIGKREICKTDVETGKNIWCQRNDNIPYLYRIIAKQTAIYGIDGCCLYGIRMSDGQLLWRYPSLDLISENPDLARMSIEGLALG